MSDTQRLPVLYIPHGGGPWPFVEMGIPPREVASLSDYLKSLREIAPDRVKAVLVISAHWEARVPTVLTNPNPPMLYDYYGFPPSTYELQWPAPGSPELAARVRALLGEAGIESAEDATRGFDHGTFVPLMLPWPQGDVPTIQLSLQTGLDPARHLEIGRALAPLRDEGVLILGSGMSFHNMRAINHPQALPVSRTFDAWLTETVQQPPAARDANLEAWTGAPAARQSHPREEHLLPLMVVAGAAGDDRGRVPWSDDFMKWRISAVHFG